MKNGKKMKKNIVKKINNKEINLDMLLTITNCPTCGVDLKGQGSCASINCPCAPRITV
jgi:hypothetical protein